MGSLGRKLAHGFVRELEQQGGLVTSPPNRIKVDAVDLIRQLGSSGANGELQFFFSMNHRWIANLSERNRRVARETHDFIEEHMGKAFFILNQFDYLSSKKELVESLGNDILDLGVYRGGSTRQLARIFPDKSIHGFDSFEGLPEDWSYTLAGSFRLERGFLPEIPDNVALYKGWFKDSLPTWRQEHPQARIALMRVDCDIYSSTVTVFEELGDLLGVGSWILFDELIGYRGWRDHEYRALQEFLDDRGLSVEYLAYGLTYVLVELVPSSV
jgi:hypothetical protein